MKGIKKTRLVAGTVVLLLLISVFAIGFVFARENAEDSIVILVHKRGDALETLDAEEFYILADYEEFVLVSTSVSNKNELLYRGYIVETLDGREDVILHSHSFNVGEGIPRIPEELSTEYPRGARRPYIVQFIGPILFEWQDELMDMGAVPLEYRHRYNMIVEMDSDLAQRVEKLDFINWVGIYQPAYKFDNTLLAKGDIMDLEVTTFTTVDTLSLAGYMEYLGADVEYVTEGLIFARADGEGIIAIANLPYVSSIAPRVTDLEFYNHDATWITQTNEVDNRKVTDMGVTGTGHLVTVCDSELYTTGGGHEMWYDTVSFGDDHRKVQDYYSIGGDLNDGVYHGSHVTGSVLGDAPPYGEYSGSDGNAIGARLIHQDIGTSGGGLSVPNDMYNRGWGRSYSEGSRSQTNSWGGGSGSAYGGLARTGDLFIWDYKDYNILFAAGNDGTGRGDGGKISQQGQGKNIITVGAAVNYNNQNNVASFSSRGYAEDGRIKPTVLHVGQGVTSSSRSADGYSSMSGTSMATPGLAGQVAQVQHYYSGGWYPTGVSTPADGFNPSNALVRATLINGAVEITGTGAYATDTRFPNSDQGYGRSKLDRVMHFEGDARKAIVFDSLQESVELSTGESWSMEFDVDDPAQELEVTLAWTDYPGANSANPAIVNDLDLELLTPGGTRYVGNAFTGYNPGYSEPDPTSNPWNGPRSGEWDGLNVDEDILLIPAENGVESGLYELRVTAHQVTEGPQPFAVVVSGGVSVDVVGSPSIDLTRPTGGESWDAETTESVTWATTPGDGAITGIDLELSLDAGDTWSYIEQGHADTGSYSWNIPQVSTSSAMIRATVHDDNTQSGIDTSGLFSIIGDPPAPPSNLGVEHTGEGSLVVFDDFSDGDYTTDPTWTAYDGDWSVEEDSGNYWLEGIGQISTPHTQAYGAWEWDFQFVRNGGGRNNQMRFYFIQDQPEPDVETCSGYYVIVVPNLLGSDPTISLWRLDDGVPPDEPLITDSWPGNEDWNTLRVERDDDDVFTIYLNGDMVGSPSSDNTYTSTTHIGFRHTAGQDTDRNRVSEVRVIGTGGDGDEHNHISWQASPDDPESVDHYAIYRSELSSGPWDPSTFISSVPADGSSSYSYTDPNKGMADDIYWWYVVRAVDGHDQDDGNSNAVQEPEGTAPETYTLTINTDGDGSVDVDPDQAEYEEGTTVELTATPASGWEFVEWTGDATGTSSTTTVTMDDDKTVTAVFAEVSTYTLTVNTDGDGSVDVDPDQAEYEEGTTVELTATPASGWEFVEWTGDATGT
ncbi:MAG: S8 family serine peptidase, partial [Thermoplasmata archaeon]